MIDFHHDVRLDQSETLFFKIPISDGKSEWLVPDAKLRWRGQWFFISQVEVDHSDGEGYWSVEADALWYRLGEYKIVGSTVITDATPTVALGNTILIGTGWAVGPMSTEDTNTFSMEMEDATALKLLREWAKVTDKHVYFDTNTMTVSLLDSRGVDRGTPFRYARNLRKIMRREAPPKVTRLYGYGADDLNVAGINGGLEYIEDFSWYTARGLSLPEAQAQYTKRDVIYDERFLEDTALLAFMETQLEEMAQGTTAYEADVIDLAGADGEDELPEFNVGDTARVADQVAGFDVVTTVTRLDRYPLEPQRNKVELASIPKVPGQTSPNSRPSQSREWVLFGSNNSLVYMRNESSHLTNRIGLRFREGGEAIFGYDVVFTGVGVGTMSISALDAETNLLVRPVLELPYTDGERVHGTMGWYFQDLEGQYDYRIRAIATSSPASAASGADILATESKFWILAHGAVRQTPTLANSVTYDFLPGGGGPIDSGGDDGTLQQFTVPDDVTQITIEARGAAGGFESHRPNIRGLGGMVTATFVVIPGTVFDVYVGGIGGQTNGTGVAPGGWPNGGKGGEQSPGAGEAPGGGGSSDVRPTGATIADALIVAAAGAGAGESSISAPNPPGGDGGFYQGQQGTQDDGDPSGGGATQFAGGEGIGAFDGAFGQGGDGAGGGGFDFGGGGGGGGWYGGGGGSLGPPTQGGGGGGSGWINDEGFDLLIEDGVQDGHGQITISWETPE